MYFMFNYKFVYRKKQTNSDVNISNIYWKNNLFTLTNPGCKKGHYDTLDVVLICFNRSDANLGVITHSPSSLKSKTLSDKLLK